MNNKNFLEEITYLENKLQDIKSEKDTLEGKCSLFAEQLKEMNIKILDFAHKRELYTKAVELLNFAQEVTKEKMKKEMEIIVSYALRYIYSSDYEFGLEFGRHGNLQSMDFNVKTPECQTPYDPLLSSGGGVLDIISLALRIALLELSKPKIPGFIVLDESFKHLSSNYLENAEKFLEAINKKIGRQIILITHKKELLNNTNNIIEIKEEKNG